MKNNETEVLTATLSVFRTEVKPEKVENEIPKFQIQPKFKTRVVFELNMNEDINLPFDRIGREILTHL